MPLVIQSVEPRRFEQEARAIVALNDPHICTVHDVGSHGAAPKLESPVPLFQTHLASGTNVLGSKPQYDVARDGRFMLNTAVESASAPIVVSLNWIR